MTGPDRRRVDDRPMTTPGPAVGERTIPPEPPDPGAIIDELRRRLRLEQERTLNATDAMRGALAEAAQARAEVRELHHRLHVRETELGVLEQLVGADGGRAAWAPTEPPAAGTPVPQEPEAATVASPGQALRVLVGTVARRIGLR